MRAIRSAAISFLLIFGVLAAAFTAPMSPIPATDSGATNTGGTGTTTSTATGTSTTDTSGTQPLTTSAAEKLFADKLKEIEEANKKSTPRLLKCKWADGTCEPAGSLYVNGDAISTIHLTGLPVGKKGLIAVTAGETWSDPNISVDVKKFDSFPQEVEISIHVSRWIHPTYGTRLKDQVFAGEGAAQRVNTATRMAGILQKAIDARAHAQKANVTPQSIDPKTSKAEEIVAREAANDLDWRYVRNGQISTGDFLSLIINGQSPLLLVRIDTDDPQRLSVTIPVRIAYQRWFVESGGFFAFMRARDETLVTDPVTGSNEQEVRQRRSTGNAGTQTGVSFNLHPGNYPNIGLQFGLIHNSDRQPTYLLGGSVRLLSIGQSALMSFSTGLAETPVRTFPGVQLGQKYPTNDARLTGQMRYTARWYFAVGVGINMGGPPPATTTQPAQ